MVSGLEYYRNDSYCMEDFGRKPVLVDGLTEQMEIAENHGPGNDGLRNDGSVSASLYNVHVEIP